MEEENLIKKENKVTNTNNKNGIVAVLVVIIIVLIGVVVYFAFIKKDDKPVDNNGGNSQVVDNGTSQVDDSSSYDAWMNYLLRQNITKITYEPGFDYEKGSYAPVKEVSIETLKAFFKEFKSHNYELIKENVQGRGDGANYINITYVKNGIEYKLSLDDVYWTTGNNDNDFMEALESMGYKEEGFEGYPLASIWYIFRDEVEDENTDIDRFNTYYAKFFK